MKLNLLARGDDWVVVDKPAGLMVHRTPGVRARYHALQLVRDLVGTHVHLVHRLDRPASGCLLFATTPEAARRLQGAMAAPTARKTYLAFVRSHWRRPHPLTVTRPLTDDRGLVRHALTEVRCAGTTSDPRSSLLIAQPSTGRYHQVRRHLQGLGHPILMDSTHGDTRINRWWREEKGLQRLGLHCLSLDLPLEGGERLVATCPVPDDLRSIWRQLPWWDQALLAVPELALEP